MISSVMIVCVWGKDYDSSVMILCIWGKDYDSSVMIFFVSKIYNVDPNTQIS